jgi:hypothetical protein
MPLAWRKLQRNQRQRSNIAGSAVKSKYENGSISARENGQRERKWRLKA